MPRKTFFLDDRVANVLLEKYTPPELKRLAIMVMNSTSDYDEVSNQDDEFFSAKVPAFAPERLIINIDGDDVLISLTENNVILSAVYTEF